MNDLPIVKESGPLTSFVHFYLRDPKNFDRTQQSYYWIGYEKRLEKFPIIFYDHPQQSISFYETFYPMVRDFLHVKKYEASLTDEALQEQYPVYLRESYYNNEDEVCYQYKEYSNHLLNYMSKTHVYGCPCNYCRGNTTQKAYYDIKHETKECRQMYNKEQGGLHE